EVAEAAGVARRRPAGRRAGVPPLAAAARVGDAVRLHAHRAAAAAHPRRRDRRRHGRREQVVDRLRRRAPRPARRARQAGDDSHARPLARGAARGPDHAARAGVPPVPVPVPGAAGVPLWQRLAPYQQNRLLAFLNPEVDPRATGWHVIQSRVAVGSGGLLGKGYTLGSQKRLAFLPAQHTDFIFSVVGEELGFVGVMAALALFVALLLVLLRVARRATDQYSSLVVFGLMAMLFTHIVENVGMTVNLLPITGIPLPFFSYGGSFLLTCSVAVGLALRVAWESRLSGYTER